MSLSAFNILGGQTLALRQSTLHPSGVSRLEAFFRTMKAGSAEIGYRSGDFRDKEQQKSFYDMAKGFMIYHDAEAVISTLQSARALAEWWYDGSQITEAEGIQVATMYGTHAHRVTKRRGFFLSEKGYMGLAPEGVRYRDVICILYGCPHPLLLRRQDDGYLLVGEAYVYGMMDGEMIEELEARKLKEDEFSIK